MTNPCHDDPRLTAYALGELDGDERRDVERLLAESPAAREAVEEIRVLAVELTAHLQSEPMPALTPQQRSLVMSGPNPSRPSRTPQPARSGNTAVVAAACLMLLAAGWIMSFGERETDRGIAKNHEGTVVADKTGSMTLDGQPVADGRRAVATRGVFPLEANERIAPGSAGKQQGAGTLSPAPIRPGLTASTAKNGQPNKPGRPHSVSLAVRQKQTVLFSTAGGAGGNGLPQIHSPYGRTPFSRSYSGFIVDGRNNRGWAYRAGQATLGFDRGILSGGDNGRMDPGKRVDFFKYDGKAGKHRFGDGLSLLGRDVAGLRSLRRESLMSLQKNLKETEEVKRLRGEANDVRPSKKSKSKSGSKSGSKKQSAGKQAIAWFKPADVKTAREQVIKQFDQLAKQHPKRELAILRVKTRLGKRLEGLERQVALAERGGQRIAAVEGRVILGEAVRAEVRTLDVDGDGRADFGSEGFDAIVENTFLTPLANPLSTLSIDVDTASYSNVRRYIDAGALPPRNAVRVEEFVNYFRYDYPQPTTKDPFSVTLEAGPCPWNVKHRLVLIGLKGREIPHDKRPPANLVFLIDVSGSMQSANRLPLVKIGLEMLIDQLRAKDRVSIVTYSNTARVALEPTPGNKKNELLTAIHSLNASGSTNGADGIQKAYDQAQKAFVKDGSNRVILCTDGDFNVGVSSDDALVKLIQEKAKSKVFLSVFGFGMGNTKHAKLEKIADKGNGHYAYIDKFQEAKKVFVEEMSGTLYTIAKDVKIQVEFNPAKVASYRLIGYENRMLAAQDFNDDKKDAGEIGAGHTVTALYEIVPVDAKSGKPDVDELKYQKRVVADKKKPVTQESLTVKLRYKQPTGETSTKIEFALKGDDPAKKTLPSENFDFASAVAMYGLLLRDSKYAGNASLDLVRELAAGAIGKDPEGRRSEFIKLVQKTESYVASQLGKPIPAGKPRKPAAK